MEIGNGRRPTYVSICRRFLFIVVHRWCCWMLNDVDDVRDGRGRWTTTIFLTCLRVRQKVMLVGWMGELGARAKGAVSIGTQRRSTQNVYVYIIRIQCNMCVCFPFPSLRARRRSCLREQHIFLLSAVEEEEEMDSQQTVDLVSFYFLLLPLPNAQHNNIKCCVELISIIFNSKNVH